MEYFVAKTFAGLETELLKELHALGAKNCEKLSRAVAFNNRQFYEQIFDFPAEEYLSPDGTLAVHATIVDTIFSTPLYASVLAKDAICDRFRDRFERRPSVDKEYPDVQFHLHIYKDEAQLFMDSSGESLHKRGYKVRNHPAPLNEVVAAAMVMKSGWSGDCDFIDPMCGGATLLVEAAMQALNIPAGFYRREYGFYQWKNFDRKLWKKVRDEADIKDDVDINFYGSDIDGRFLDIARANVQKARLQDFIILERQDIRHSSPENVPSVVMMNPPYGERLSVDDINTLYQEIGDTLKKRYAGCKAFIISSDVEALKHIGLKPAHKWPMLNGSLECMFQEYELFAGDRKQFVTNKMRKK